MKDHDIVIPDAIRKAKEIKKENPEFNKCLNALAYSFLTKEQIMSLSEEAVEEINSRFAGYVFYKDKYNLTKNYLKRGIKFVKFKDGLKSVVKKKSRN